MVDITVRPETGTQANFYDMGYPEAKVGLSAHVRYNAETVAPDIAAEFADTLHAQAANQQTTPNGNHYFSREDRGMQTVFSWVAPEDRSPDEKGKTFVGAIYFGDKGQDDGQSLNTVLSYALFETPDGQAKVESQVGVYPVGVPADYLGSLTENERPSAWFQPHSYDPNFAGYNVGSTPVTNAELGMVLDYANPSDTVDAGPAAFGFDTSSSVPGIDASPALGMGASFEVGAAGGIGGGSMGAGGSAAGGSPAA